MFIFPLRGVFLYLFVYISSSLALSHTDCAYGESMVDGLPFWRSGGRFGKKLGTCFPRLFGRTFWSLFAGLSSSGGGFLFIFPLRGVPSSPRKGKFVIGGLKSFPIGDCGSFWLSVRGFGPRGLPAEGGREGGFSNRKRRSVLKKKGLARFGLAWLGLAWFGLACLGLAWLGLVWLGLAWLFE